MMPLPVPTTIATGFGDATGSAYRRLTDQYLIADSGSGTIWAVNPHTHAKTTLGTGYSGLSDIEVSSDGQHAYVVEGAGTLYRVNLSSANKAGATVVATALGHIDQIFIDEARGYGYVLAFTEGNLVQVNLTTGVKSTVLSGLFAPRGLLMTSDARFFYISGDAGNITRYDRTTNTSQIIASGLNAPRHLTFADAGESTILFPQRNPTGTILKVDLSASPAVVTPIAGPTPSDPYSVAVLSSNQLLITSAGAISEVDLTGSVFSAAGPTLLGIGFVPADAAHLPNGYADTSADPSYFFQVKDAPFGGTLPLMINHDHARSAGASFYQVFIAGPIGPAVPVNQVYTDYLWNVALNEFVATPVAPLSGYYPVHGAGQIWLNYWLGLLLNTSAQPNGLNTISVKLFGSQNPASEIGHSTDAGRHATLMIDNTVPTALINSILHDGSPVGTCAIVNSGSHNFTFNVTAEAIKHLLGWSLVAYWGDNKSKAVASDSYSNHVSPTRLWQGITSVVVPPPGPAPWNADVAGDPTSFHCAHTFSLAAWDRVINGWGYIHGAATYNKSITLFGSGSV